MSDFGIARRLKRVRSVSTANSELDAELQSSIRRQNSSKRTRVSSANLSIGSYRSQQLQDPESSGRRQGGRRNFSNVTVPDLKIEATGRNESQESYGSIRSLWTSMSGFFARDRTPAASVRETVDAYEALQNTNHQAYCGNSPRDSGVYFDSRPSSRLKPDTASTGDGASQRPEHTFTLGPPNFPPADPSISPLKRLQTASMTGLRKVKSLALRSQPSRENVQKGQRQILIRKMSNLQNQLDECKQEFAQLFGEAIEPGSPERPETARETPSSPKSDRGTQTMIGFAAGGEMPSDSPVSSPVYQSIEPAEHVVADQHSPNNWPLPTREGVQANPGSRGPALRRKPEMDLLRTPEPRLDKPMSGSAALVERALQGNVDAEHVRRSLSTIPSSEDERSSPGEENNEKKENERPVSSRSMRTSRIPRQSSRRVDIHGNENQLPVIHSVTSSRDAIPVTESPRTRLAKQRARMVHQLKGTQQKHSKSKKMVGNQSLGHYDETGEWVWGPEAF